MARDLLNRANEFVGIDQRVWALLETGGYGTDATGGLIATATDAIEHVNAKLEFNIPREDAAHRSGRSKVTRLSGKKECKVSFESYILPADPISDLPQLPDSHPMLLSAFGAVDTGTPSAIVYSLARKGSYSFRMLEEGTHFSRLAVGCVIDSLTFTLPGDGKAMMKAEGFAQDCFSAGQSTLAQAVTGSAIAASKVIQDLTYTADATGQAGNLITIAYTTGAVAGSEVVTVTGTAISVQISTGVSTATQVKAAVDASIAASALISVSISGVGGTAQTAPVAATNLSGGLGTNDFKVASGHGPRFEVGSYVDFIDKDDGNTLKNTARKISARGSGANSDILTVSGAVLVASDASDIVIGTAPDFTATSSANALLGLKGSFATTNFGTVNCDLLSAEIAIKNNYTPRANSYGRDTICGFVSDKRREVSIKLEVLLTKDNYEFYSSNKRFVADGLTITLAPQECPAPINSGTGRTMTFALPKCEFNVPQIEQPGDGFIKLTLEGVALSTDVNTPNAELTLTIS